MDENFSLKWIQFEKNLSHSFVRLREEGNFLDVTLIAGDGSQVQAHRNVLSSCSELFKSILVTCPTPHPVIYLSDISSEHLTFALDYIYHGEVKIAKDLLYCFLKVAQKLHLDELQVDIDNDTEDDDRNEDEDRNVIEEHKTEVPDEETSNEEDIPEWIDEIPEPIKVQEERVSDASEEDLNMKVSNLESTDLLGEEDENLQDIKFPDDEISDLVYEELKEEMFDFEENFDEDYDYYEEVPEHKFLCEKTVRKGVPTTRVTLCIGDRIYRKRKMIPPGKIQFSCTGCEKVKKNVNAIAKLVNDKYKLVRSPLDEVHVCSPDNYAVDMIETRKLLQERIVETPSQSLQEIYNEVVKTYAESLEEERREVFLKRFPTYKQLVHNLRQFRKKSRGGVTVKKPLEETHYPPGTPLPDHRFQVKPMTGQEGSGAPSSKVWLFIGNRIYRKRYRRSYTSRNLTFTCTGCEKRGKHVSASVSVKDEVYQLTLVPREERHVCSPNNVSIDKKLAVMQLYEAVLAEPDRTVGEIYKEVKERYAENMEPERRREFLERFPPLKNVEGGLYRKRVMLREREEQRKRLAEITSQYTPTFAPVFSH